MRPKSSRKQNKVDRGAAGVARAQEKKWSATVWELGWTGVPNVLLDHQCALKIGPIELNILVHLIRHWWERERHPYPSKATLAKAIGVTPRTVQRRIGRLEELGLIRRETRFHPKYGRQSNSYVLDELVDKLIPLAKTQKDAKERNRNVRAATLARSREQIREIDEEVA